VRLGVELASCLGAYLLGSVSFSFLVVRRLRGDDVRQLGSGNAGATNVLRTTGGAAAFAVLVLDMAKGWIAVMVCRELGLSQSALAAAGCAAVAGHAFPVYHGFRGGKGVAAAAGVLAALETGTLVICLGIFIVVVAATRIVSLGSMLGTLAAPIVWWGGGVLGWWDSPTTPSLAWAALMAGLILLRHRKNLVRMAHGTERRLQGREEWER